jgi:hypothetical protein
MKTDGCRLVAASNPRDLTRPFPARVHRTSLVALIAGSRRSENETLSASTRSFRAPSGQPAATLAAAKGRLIRCTVPRSTPNCFGMTRTPAAQEPPGLGFVCPLANYVARTVKGAQPMKFKLAINGRARGEPRTSVSTKYPARTEVYEKCQ